MRRKDREIVNMEKIRQIILACDCCRLAMLDGDSVYIVPMNFGYTPEGDGVFYFHCAMEGKKLDLIHKNPQVGFELDTNHELVAGERGCGYTFRFQSVIGKGHVERIADPAEKKMALGLILSHYAQRRDWDFTDAETNSVAVLRMKVLEIACKEHL